MTILGILSIILSGYLLHLAFEINFQWLLSSLVFLGLGIFLIMDRLSYWIEEKSILYHSNPNKNCDSLFKTKKITQEKYIVVSTLPVSLYYLIPGLGVLFFFILTGNLYYAYHINQNIMWLSGSIVTFCLAVFSVLVAVKLFKMRGEQIIFDSVKNMIHIKSPIQRATQQIPFGHIKQLIVKRSNQSKKELSKFYEIQYQVILELKNGRKKLLEKGKNEIHIQTFVHRIRDILKVRVVDYTSLGLQMKELSYNKITAQSKSSYLEQLNYNKEEGKEVFSWKRKDNLSSMMLELFFIIISFSSIFLSIKILSFNILFEFVFVLAGLTLILIVIFIKNHFGKEFFIFSEGGIIYQHRLFNKIIQENTLNYSEIKNTIFIFDDAVLEGEKNYLIGNISVLSAYEKRWLKRRWSEILNLPTSLELERNLVRFS